MGPYKRALIAFCGTAAMRELPQFTSISTSDLAFKIFKVIYICELPNLAI